MAPRPKPISTRTGGDDIRVGAFLTKNHQAKADALGVTLIRPLAVYANESHYVQRYKAHKAIAYSGEYDLSLEIRARRVPPDGPNDGPRSFTDYERQLRNIFEEFDPYEAAIENEAQDRIRYYTGTAEKYLRQMETAANVAASRPFRVKLMDSGFTSESLELYFRAVEAGAKLEGTGLFIDTVLKGLKDAGCMYVNMHMYQPVVAKLGIIADKLKALTGLPIRTNEVGGWLTVNGDPNINGELDPTEVKGKLDAAKANGLESFVFFSHSTRQGQLYGAVNLFKDNDSLELTPAGIAFRDWVAQDVASGVTD